MTRAILLMCLMAAPALQNDQQAPPDAEAALKREVKDFSTDGTFESVLKQYEEMAGVKIVVDWAALKSAGVEPTTRCSVKSVQTTVGQLLTTTLAGMSSSSTLIWYADKDVVRVTTREALQEKIRLAQAMVEAQKAKAQGPPGRLDMDEIPLSEVIEFFRNVSGVNIHVNWKALNLVGVDQTSPITLKAEGISIGRALDLVADQLNGGREKMSRVYWIIDDGMVKISTGAALNEEMRTKTYDVADLLFVVPSFKAPRADLTRGSPSPSDRNRQTRNIWEPAQGAQDQEKEPSADEKRKQAADNLIEIIKGIIGQDMWQEGGGKGSIRIMNNKLIVTQSLLGFKLIEESLRSR